MCKDEGKEDKYKVYGIQVLRFEIWDLVLNIQ